ncbi:DCC1-like thiol-disulfide oxidoreductase family protein [Halomonas denitrificans]|uniref:DCC1-like thiol-disulfide oxidoreductase family protein n=1 Tax=Halomonas denitrificans TaxID=370769 RepID=UPI000D37EC4E|nr:DCC1-like thiol-disulfide oxidoreductase family protein [Halomonas denitrificans]
MSSQRTPRPTLTLVYDGECPLCRQFVRLQRLRRDVGDLALIDARQESDARRELSEQGIDLDEGVALRIGEHWVHGSEALHRLALMSTGSGLFNRLMARLFASPERTARLYPWLRRGRALLLRLLGRESINNLRRR